MDDFAVRALELHSQYAWDYDWIITCMDFMQGVGLNTLILHRNDFIDLIAYPGKYFGCDDSPCASIFERYKQIFRTLYRYTPTRRSGPYQRRAFLKRVLEQAGRRGIDVYIENKELYFPEILLEFFPHLVHEGKICATDPFWWEFTKVKFTEFFEEFPEIKGIITAPATGESKISITSNRCTCERCRNTTRAQWFDTLLRTMHTTLLSFGKQLVVRDFVFNPEAHHEIASAMEALPSDVIISLKNTPHDYYPTFPENSRIGKVGDHRQWIEFDTMGQYFGWGIGMADLTEDYRWRMTSAQAKGADGVIFRTDWESLDGHTTLRNHNMVNLYAGAALAQDVHTPTATIHDHYLQNEGWYLPTATQADKNEACAWFSGISGSTWSIASRTSYVDECVFSDSSLMPISMEHAFWLAEEKNSLKAWIPAKASALAPTLDAVRKALDEKESALRDIKALIGLAKTLPPALKADKGHLLQQRLMINERYVVLFRAATRALLLCRYALATKEDRDNDCYGGMVQDACKAVEDLRALEITLRAFHRETDYHPHTIYTLLDPDRVACLAKDLWQLLTAAGLWCQEAPDAI